MSATGENTGFAAVGACVAAEPLKNVIGRAAHPFSLYGQSLCRR